MVQKISLKEAERKAFRAAYNDGLWDIFLGCFFLMFAVAPLLSSTLGDFWSSAIFLPFWAIAYLAIWLVRKRVVAPRAGVVKFGARRVHKLMKFTLVMLVINVVALVLGFVYASSFDRLSRHLPMFTLGLIFLIVFFLAAYFLDFNRLYFYGLLTGFAPLVGEWLYTFRNASHHGLPVTFGVSSSIMILVGLYIFLRFLQENPVPTDEITLENA